MCVPWESARNPQVSVISQPGRNSLKQNCASIILAVGSSVSEVWEHVYAAQARLTGNSLCANPSLQGRSSSSRACEVWVLEVKRAPPNGCIRHAASVVSASISLWTRQYNPSLLASSPWLSSRAPPPPTPLLFPRHVTGVVVGVRPCDRALINPAWACKALPSRSQWHASPGGGGGGDWEYKHNHDKAQGTWQKRHLPRQGAEGGQEGRLWGLAGRPFSRRWAPYSEMSSRLLYRSAKIALSSCKEVTDYGMVQGCWWDTDPPQRISTPCMWSTLCNCSRSREWVGGQQNRRIFKGIQRINLKVGSSRAWCRGCQLPSWFDYLTYDYNSAAGPNTRPHVFWKLSEVGAHTLRKNLWGHLKLCLKSHQTDPRPGQSWR